jgi:hypothetical protein
MPAHSTLTGADLHEPKGAAAASSGAVYIADGAGSGVFGPVAFSHSQVYSEETDSSTVATIGTTAQTLVFHKDGPSSLLTPAFAAGTITVTGAGNYYVSVIVSCSTVAAGDAGTYELKVLSNGVASTLAAKRDLSGTSDHASLSTAGILALSGSAVLSVTIESDSAANTDDLNIYNATFSVLKLS